MEEREYTMEDLRYMLVSERLAALRREADQERLARRARPRATGGAPVRVTPLRGLFGVPAGRRRGAGILRAVPHGAEQSSPEERCARAPVRRLA